MAKFIVNPNTPQAWEIPLNEGLISLGRNEGNQVPIQHSSLSGSHCQIETKEGIVTLRDLGSTNGSFVEGHPVSEAALRDGQVVRLGEVELKFVAEPPNNAPAAPRLRFSGASPRVSLARTASEEPGPAQPATSASVLDAVPSTPMNCKFHPKAPAGYYCTQCNKAYCSLCVNQRSGAYYCRSCAQPCTVLDLSYLTEAREEIPFFKQLPTAFSYPFKGSGIWMMLIGSVLFAGVSFAAQYSRYVWVLMIGYSALYAQGIIHATSQGDVRGPAWPDTDTNIMAEVRAACWKVVLTCALCFAPAFGLLIWGMSGEQGEISWKILPAILAALTGCAYLPMSLLAVAMFDSITAMNPVVVVPSIARIPLPYLLTSMILMVVILLKWGIYWTLEILIPVPIVPDLLTSLVGFYFLTVSTFILGLMYYTQRHRIGWFNH